MLDSLGVYTGREPGGQTAETSVTTAPDPHAAPQTTQPPIPAPQTSPTAPTPPAPAAQPPATTEPSTDLIGDLSKAFAKSIGEMPATTEPPKDQPPAQPPPAETEPPKPPEKTWRDQEPPAHVTKKVQEDWRSFKEKAKADVDARDARIKGLETELADSKKAVPTVQGELEQVKKALDAANQIVERVAIERSPLFRSKVTEPLELIKARLEQVVAGTGLTPQDVNTLTTGDLNARESIIESRQLSSFRKTQISDLLSRWDQVGEERDRLVSRGKESMTEFFKQQQEVEESRRAQFMRESEKIFDDQDALCTPKLEPYCKIDGNEEWNANTLALRQAARRIYSGSVDRQTLAQVALLAPAAVVYQKLFQGAQKRIQELEAQVSRMRGVAPTVRDRGGDVPTPASPPGTQSPNGDFVKDLVSKFQKSTGLQ
jgi:hypothetical protein